jgi:hypothetical protein
MNNTLEHDKLGPCEVLMEVEIQGKHLILVRSLQHRRHSKTGEVWYQYKSYKTKNRLMPLYYVLWGNEIGSKMGVTPLYTPTGRPKTRSSSTKAFLEMVNTSTSLTFKH